MNGERKQNREKFSKHNALNGALGEIRTPDPRNRNPMLYPAELRARVLTIAEEDRDASPATLQKSDFSQRFSKD